MNVKKEKGAQMGEVLEKKRGFVIFFKQPSPKVIRRNELRGVRLREYSYILFIMLLQSAQLIVYCSNID
jgi:hypothetical protein